MGFLSGALDIVGGIEAQKASREQIKATREEAAEVKRQSLSETKSLKSRQIVNFLKSGVILEGTPIEILEETQRLGEEDIASIARQERAQISQLKAQGRAALLSGISSGIGKFAAPLTSLATGGFA